MKRLSIPTQFDLYYNKANNYFSRITFLPPINAVKGFIGENIFYVNPFIK